MKQHKSSESTTVTNSMSQVISNKIDSLQNIVKHTILAAQKYKSYDILSANDLNSCTSELENIFQTLRTILYPISKKQTYDNDQIIGKLQDINSELSSIFKSYGTEYIDDLLDICLGSNYVHTITEDKELYEKYKVIRKYVHPISYKAIPWKSDHTKKNKLLQKNRIVEDFMIVESAATLECFDLARTSKSFLTKVYGIKFAIQNEKEKKTIIVYAVVDDIMLSCMNYSFITDRIESFKNNRPADQDYHCESFDIFADSLTLKEILVYDNEKTVFTIYRIH